ncbi:hypothetical protein ACGFXC_06520 [Streptomyces sp. NPDC048507]
MRHQEPGREPQLEAFVKALGTAPRIVEDEPATSARSGARHG